MKVQITDLSVAKSIRPSQVEAYLSSMNWAKYSTAEHFSVWISDDEEFEVVVPRHDSPDFARQLLSTLRELEKREKRSQAEIVNDLMRSGFDVVRIAAQGPKLQDGSISIEDGIQLFLNAQNLLLASACASVRPQAVFHARKPQRANEYLEQARLGQTEHGSFVLTILSPVAPFFGETARPEGLFASDPFERAVVRTLASASNVVANAIASSPSHPDNPFAGFQDGVKLGVSANLCEALAGFFSEGDTQNVDIKVAWSVMVPAPKDSPSLIRINKSSVPLIKEAAQVFRRTEPLPNVTISGPIIKLERGDGVRNGKVTMLSKVEERLRKVSFALPSAEYAIATEAHKQNDYITLTGDLKKIGRSLQIENPSNFALAKSQQVSELFDSLVDGDD